MTDSCYINNNKKEEIDKNLQTLKATDIIVDRKTNPIEERVTRIEDKRKDFIKERSTIESVRDIINKDKERGTREKSTRGRRNRGSSIGLSGGILYIFLF